MSKTIKQVGFISIMLIMGGLFGYLIGSLIPDPVTQSVVAETSNTSSNPLVTVILLFLHLGIIAYAVILIHELGHCFGGYLADYTPYQVIAGVTIIDFSGKYWRIRWNRDWASSGGLCISLSKHNRNSRWRYLTFVIAGPLTTLLTGLISIALWAFLPQNPMSLSLLFFAFISSAICIATIFPLPMGLLRTDGYRAIKLIWQYDDEARAWIAATDIIAHMTSGQTLQTVDDELFVMLHGNPHEKFSVTYYEYLRALEIGDNEKILERANTLQAMLEDLPSIVVKDIEKELAFVYGWVAPNLEQFQQYYARVEKALDTKNATNYRVQAAHYRMSGQFDEAKEKLALAQQFLQTDRTLGYGSEQVIVDRLLADLVPMFN